MVGTLDQFREDTNVTMTDYWQSVPIDTESGEERSGEPACGEPDLTSNPEPCKVDKGEGKKVDTGTTALAGMSISPNDTLDITVNLTSRLNLLLPGELRDIAWKEPKFDPTVKEGGKWVVPSGSAYAKIRNREPFHIDPAVASDSNTVVPSSSASTSSAIKPFPSPWNTIKEIWANCQAPHDQASSTNSSSSSKMGVTLDLEEPIVEVESDETQLQNKLLKDSIPEPRDPSPPSIVDSAIGLTPSSSQQSHDSTLVTTADNQRPPADPFIGPGPTSPVNRVAGSFCNDRFVTALNQPFKPIAHRSPARQPMGYFQYDGTPVKNFQPQTPRSVGGWQRVSAQASSPQPRPLPIAYSLELLSLPILSRPDDQGTTMHATGSRFGPPVWVSIPTQILRVRITHETHRQGGHILTTAFEWKRPDGTATLVRLGQDNWHRILENVQEQDFHWFSSQWKAQVKRIPEGEAAFFEECTSCKEAGNVLESDGADQSLQGVSRVIGRPWNFRHRLKQGIELIAD